MSCGGLGGYTGLGLPLDPSILQQNPGYLRQMISTMPPQQIVQLLPLYGSLANRYPEYIPIIIGMLNPDQRPQIPQFPQGIVQPFPQGQGILQPIPQGQGILQSIPQGQGILQPIPQPIQG
uniref:Uncharacterized protein n=1 Tax=Meloidogyne floridensis TaxID=298350 RepID=A0A915PDV7_9BILA